MSMQQNIYGNTRKNSEGIQNVYENTEKISEDTQNITDIMDLELLSKLYPVHDAGYQAGHHDTCLPGTRESVLDGIMRWAGNPQDRHIFWLNGVAGTGKSTIAQTFSEIAAEAGTFGASFFCSRDYLDRKELKNIFPTLAYQLACRYPAFRGQVTRVLKRDPSVARNSLMYQFKDLIVNPLTSTNIPCVIVVDALDECADNEPASAILSVLGRYVKNLPSVKFFITGRPEPRIRSGFRLPLLEPITQIFLLHEVELSSVDEDIRLYLQEKLTAVAKRRSHLNISHPWPCDHDLTFLTKKSSGLFIFASTLARFIESEHHEPNERLQLIINPPDRTLHEGRAGIDPLYTQVLQLAFSGITEAAVFTNLRKVLGTVILAFNPLSRDQVAKLLDVSTPLIATTLRHLHSVLLVPDEDSKEIRVFHKSFPDFLQDYSRCPDPKFLIDTHSHHGDIALSCLELLKRLKPNPCDLPDYVMNRDVPNLPELLEDKVGGATRYACGYWAMHLRSSPTTGHYAVQLIASATELFNTNVIQWIEVMSLENRLESVVHSINNLFQWCGMVDLSTSNLHNIAEDYLRFTKNFFPLIQQSAPHIYHSALPLSPRSSTFHPVILWEKTPIAEFYGRPETWGPVVQTIQGDPSSFTCMTTLGHWIAVACTDAVVRIYDTVTGALRLSLRSIDPVKAMRGPSDGSTLFCAHQENLVTLWDIQTGGLIHSFTLMDEVQDIAVSLKGRYLACRLSNGFVKVWGVVGEVLVDVAIQPVSPGARLCWLEPEERLVIAGGTSAAIWNIVAGEILRSFTTVNTISGVLYSQELNRLAVTTEAPSGDTVVFIDPQTGTSSVLSGVQGKLSCFAFSRTSEELMCGTRGHGLKAFSFSTRRWRCLKPSDTTTFVSSLPNGTIAAASVRSGIQLLGLDDGHASPPELAPTRDVWILDQGRIIVIVPITRHHIELLETSSMSQLSAIPIQDTPTIPANIPTVLSASLENRVVVYCFKAGENVHLHLRKFGYTLPKWIVKINRLPSACGISPTGTRLVTFHNAERATRISVRDAKNGQLQAELLVNQAYSLPPDITFDSETRFYSLHGPYRVSYDLDFSSRADTTRPVIHHERQPWTAESSQRQRDVDSSHEWVVSGSERICWIPPGYIRSTQGGYCWAGSDTLVTVDEDGTLRMLTFRS
ncbi:hypothetical protein BJ322DRAFT_1061653 [Thelephora terrestris]|uniref:NACHT domain-containing protein n=1 Tax=Thelephora terrestris TaxID=56493 RepID=A0A9P6HEN7_9AGAM|nr:hypothetical protein BJ322DRAFT_1061653 [Thelephora terrestris]